jgi:hypothetical protein
MTAAAERKSDPGIYKFDTVPPPAGEDSAYDAVTKVGPMARAAIDKMFAEAESQHLATIPPASGVRAKAVVAPAVPRPTAPAPLPVLYDAADEDVEGSVDSMFDPTGITELPKSEAPAVAFKANAMRATMTKPRTAGDAAVTTAFAEALVTASEAFRNSPLPPTLPVVRSVFMPVMSLSDVASPRPRAEKPPLPALVAAVIASLVLLGLVTNAIVGALAH